jgi:sirohydrochlorin cobaltochelatase
MTAEEGLLLVGHGSRSAEAEKEMGVLAAMVAGALPGVAVELGYLEMSDPPAGVALDRLVASGVRRLTVLPLMLFGAGHAKSDVPAVVLEGRHRHPGVDIRFGSPLGVSRSLVATLGRSLDVAGARGLPLVVVARGTSDPDANGDAAKAARLLAEWNGSPFHLIAFTGVTGPSVPEVLDVAGRLGIERLAVAFWFLCTGLLVERARLHLGRFAAGGRTVVDAGYLGPCDEVAGLVVDRVGEALAGRADVNCDLCAYRAPWPGREERAGQAAGVGHSHLAAAHRHPADPAQR